MKRFLIPYKRLLLVGLAVISLLVIGVLALKHSDNANLSRNEMGSRSTEATKSSQAKSNKEKSYLTITEWGVHVSLPEELRGNVTYSMMEPIIDPDGNHLESARIYIKAQAVPGQGCSIEDTVLGPSVATGALYIRSEASKPFDAKRYRWTFKEDILEKGSSIFHLSYVIPDCLSSSSKTIQLLDEALLNLRSVE